MQISLLEAAGQIHVRKQGNQIYFKSCMLM